MLEAAIVGAGPYGLSIAAHLRRTSVPYRIFGRPMDSWISHMPKGMLLKSDGFASNLSDPDGQFTLKQFCRERGIDYADMGTPVQLDTFTAYGLAFRERFVPELEENLVSSIEPRNGGFLLTLENGETEVSKRVILAVGITHFWHVPESLQHLPCEFLSHSFGVSDFAAFRGRNVAVIGGGASAIDLAGLLHEAGVHVQLIAREKALIFHEKSTTEKPRSLWLRVRSPSSGLGPGLRSRFFADAPGVFHRLPQGYRIQTTRTFLGPAGGWFAKEKIAGKVPVVLGFAPVGAELQGNQVCLHLRDKDGGERSVQVDHIIAATGYRVDLKRLVFLNPALREKIETVQGAPVLSSSFECSMRGLYFGGLAAANSFGPVMRFACGAPYTARCLAEVVK